MNVSRPIRRALVLMLLAGGCKPSGPANAIDLTIMADGSLNAAALASVRSLTIAVSGVHSGMKTYPLTSLPKQETVTLLPTVTSGPLTVTVTAHDGNMNLVASGASTTTVTGKAVLLTVVVKYQAPPVIAVAPATVTVTRGKTQAFTATLPSMMPAPVKWSVMGGDANGTIDASGVYTAPMTPGTYTVVAAGATQPGDSASAVVTVADYGVELLAGALGGIGEADGIGGAARFNGAFAVASDGVGGLYVGDGPFGSTLRKINLATAAVTTLGGVPARSVSVDGKLGSTAEFNGMRSFALDAATNTLYIGTNDSIRIVNLTTGDVTTLTQGFAPLGLAFDGAKQVLYASRPGGHNIATVTLGPMEMETLLAGTPGAAGSADGTGNLASFNRPAGLAFDGTNLYVADGNNHTIRQIVVSSGVVTTLAGSAGVPGFVDGVGAAARFTNPVALTLDAAKGILYITEGQNTVRSLVLATRTVALVAGAPKVAPPAGTPVTFQGGVDGTGAAARFGALEGIAYDPPTGNLYTAEIETEVIRSIKPGGVVGTLAGTPAPYGDVDGPGSSARFWQIGSLATDGKVYYVTDNTNAVVRKYDPATGTVSTLAGKAGLVGGDDGAGDVARFARPEGVFVDGNLVYLSDGSGNTIRQLDPATNTVTTIAGKFGATGITDGAGTAARFSYPVYLTGDHAGHLYVADFGAPIIRRVTLATAQVDTIAGNATMRGIMDGVGSAAQFVSPYGLALENGRLYVCDTTAIRSVTLDNFTVTTVAGGATLGLADGVGTAATFTALGACGGDGNGHLYGGDSGLMRRFDVVSGAVSTVFGKPFHEIGSTGPLASATLVSVSGIAFTPVGDLVYEDSSEGIFLVRIP